MDKPSLMKLIFDTWITNDTGGKTDTTLEEYALEAPEDFEAVEKIADRLMAVFANSVPLEPSKPMWEDDLVRCIIRWMRYGDTTPHKLFTELALSGVKVPKWLVDEPEMAPGEHVVSKGTCAVIVYRAMIDAHQRTAKGD